MMRRQRKVNDESTDMTPDMTRLLRPVSGPTISESRKGRTLLLQSLGRTRPRRRSFGFGRLGTAGVVAGALVFGSLAVGAGAAGLGLSVNVEDLLSELGVPLPEEAASHIEDLPARDLPDAVPETTGSLPQAQAIIGEPAAEANAMATTIAQAVAGVIDATDPGQGLGAAVSSAACEELQFAGKPACQGAPPAVLPAIGGAPASNSNAPAGVPPVTPGAGNPAGAPPENPGAGHGVSDAVLPVSPPGSEAQPPVSAPPAAPGPPSVVPTNPVGAPPETPAVSTPTPGGPPPLPDTAQPPELPGPGLIPPLPVELPLELPDSPNLPEVPPQAPGGRP